MQSLGLGLPSDPLARNDRSRALLKELNLAHRTRVTGQLIVRGEQGDALAERLREEQAVEWVLVQWWKHVDVHRVLAGDRELRVPIVEQASPQDTRLDLEIASAQRFLDGDLPEAGGTEQQLVVLVFEDLGCCPREALGR